MKEPLTFDFLSQPLTLNTTRPSPLWIKEAEDVGETHALLFFFPSFVFSLKLHFEVMTSGSGSFVCCNVGAFPSDSALCHSDLNVRGWVFLIRPRSPQKSPLNYLIHFQGKRHSSGYYYL